MKSDDLDDLLKELETGGKPSSAARPQAGASKPATPTVVTPSASSPIGRDIQSLLSSSEGNQELALRNIINFCLEEPNRVMVRQHGGIPPVVKLLSSPNPEIQGLAAHALANLALQPDNRTAVRETGDAIQTLVRVLSETHHDSVREKLLAAIANLCVDDPTNRQEFSRVGLIKTVVSVLNSSSTATSDDVIKRALTTIVNTSFDPTAQRDLVTSGGVHAILPLASSSNLEKQTNSAWALAALTMGGPDVQKALHDSGALPVFVRLLGSGNPNAEMKALTALVNLSGNDLLQRPLMVAQAIPAAIAHISSPNVTCVRLALQSLQNLALNSECRLAVHGSGGVQKIMGVLRAGCTTREHVETMPHALRVVINLTGDQRVRRAFVDEGAIPIVERLTNERDATVSGTAKQALNNLKIPC